MMENGYEQIYAHSMENYNRLLADYNSVTETPEYKDCVYGSAFGFLKALYLANRIDFYALAEAERKPVFEFSSVQEALSTYGDLMNFNETVKKILDKASLIIQADRIAEKINNYVKLSDYLDNSLAVERDTLITPFAKECISVLPRASKEITPGLRLDMLKDMLNTFNKKQVSILAAKGVFSAEDIDPLLSRVSMSAAKENIEVLCKGFGVSSTLIKQVDFNLKGVTFKNDDGSSRQEILKELDEYVKATGTHPTLYIEPFIYHPELGEPEAAARVWWGNKCLGNVPRDIAIQLHNEYGDKIYAAELINVVGGDTTYGVKISLDIREPIELNTKNVEAEIEPEIV